MNQMDDKTIAECLGVIQDSGATTAQKENAEYEIKYRQKILDYAAKGGDRPTYNPPNP